MHKEFCIWQFGMSPERSCRGEKTRIPGVAFISLSHWWGGQICWDLLLEQLSETYSGCQGRNAFKKIWGARIGPVIFWIHALQASFKHVIHWSCGCWMNLYPPAGCWDPLIALSNSFRAPPKPAEFCFSIIDRHFKRMQTGAPVPGWRCEGYAGVSIVEGKFCDRVCIS